MKEWLALPKREALLMWAKGENIRATNREKVLIAMYAEHINEKGDFSRVCNIIIAVDEPTSGVNDEKVWLRIK